MAQAENCSETTVNEICILFIVIFSTRMQQNFHSDCRMLHAQMHKPEEIHFIFSLIKYSRYRYHISSIHTIPSELARKSKTCVQRVEEDVNIQTNATFGDWI